MEDLIKRLSQMGSGIVKGFLAGEQAVAKPIKYIQEDFTNRFNQWQPKAFSQGLDYNHAINNLKNLTNGPLQFLTPIQAPKVDLSGVQERFNQAQTWMGNNLDQLKPNFDAFYKDLGVRANRVDQRYIEPAKQEVGNFLEFAQGKGPRAENFRNSTIAKMTPEDMALNFTPMGYTNAGKAGVKAAAETITREGRLSNLLNYGKELISRGFKRGQVDKIGFKEGQKILDSNMTPLDWIKSKGNFDSAKAFEDSLKSSIDVKSKVNIFDYFRTPEYVLNKIGLGKQAQELRSAFDKYTEELPQEIQRITDWSKRVSPEANQRIFQWLDGKKNTILQGDELKVAEEIKGYLSNWADKLGLPKEGRITNYITHIFDQDLIKKEFDPDLAKIIRDKVAGSVYDPFVEQRLGKTGYVEDTWRALDAYVKRATRKVNMDPVLKKISDISEGLEDSQFKYVKSRIDRINMRPTDVDNLIDNFIKSTPFGYRLGARPFTVVTQKARQMVYRGLLGLNPKVALLNLTQGANTYSKLGEKYTLIGYSKVLQNMPKFLLGKGTEIHDVGVLTNNIIEDRTLSATKQTLQKLDDGLFYLFNLAEKINRGAAYWGGKAKALNQGMSEAEAIKYAKQLVRETQFTFGSIDTPQILSSDLAKTLGQFQSYTLKQGEFLGGMAKSKDIAGLVRWTAASMFMVSTLGRLWGMKVEDLIPSVRMGVPPTLQAAQGAWETVTGQKDQFGNEPNPNIVARALENKNLQKGVTNYFPAGGQIRKSLEGLKSIADQGVYSDSGRLRYPTDDGARSVIFGPNTSEYASEYYDKNLQPLGEKQTEYYKMLVEGGMTQKEAYNYIRAKQEQDKAFKESLEPQEEGFDWFGLFQNKNQETKQISPQATTGDALLDALSKEKGLDERAAKIREVFNSGLSKDQIEKVLQQNDLGSYEDGAIIMMKSLQVENGSRPDYLKTLLSNLDDQTFQKTIASLAKAGVLTTSVTNYWEDQGQITTAQKKAFDNMINVAKGKATSWKKPKGLGVLKKITVTLPSNPKPKPIQAPKLKFPSLKPLIPNRKTGGGK